jgi:hypothetical protein
VDDELDRRDQALEESESHSSELGGAPLPIVVARPAPLTETPEGRESHDADSDDPDAGDSEEGESESGEAEASEPETPEGPESGEDREIVDGEMVEPSESRPAGSRNDQPRDQQGRGSNDRGYDDRGQGQDDRPRRRRRGRRGGRGRNKNRNNFDNNGPPPQGGQPHVTFQQPPKHLPSPAPALPHHAAPVQNRGPVQAKLPRHVTHEPNGNVRPPEPVEEVEEESEPNFNSIHYDPNQSKARSDRDNKNRGRRGGQRGGTKHRRGGSSGGGGGQGNNQRHYQNPQAKFTPNNNFRPRQDEPRAREMPSTIRTGSADKHLASDEPIAPQPMSRPRSNRDLDSIPDDYD